MGDENEDTMGARRLLIVFRDELAFVRSLIADIERKLNFSEIVESRSERQCKEFQNLDLAAQILSDLQQLAEDTSCRLPQELSLERPMLVKNLRLERIRARLESGRSCVVAFNRSTDLF